MSPAPRELDFSFPPEWALHDATWMSFPRPDGQSFPGRYDRVLPNLANVIRTIALFETVRINIPDKAWAQRVRDLVGSVDVETIEIPTNEPWCRDHGPAFVVDNEAELAVVNWRYNAWGGKYPPWDDDDAVPKRIAEHLGLRLFEPGIVMEGGAVDFDGRGSVLTTRDCLLNPNRNGNLNIHDVEGYLLDFYGQERVHWLTGGIAGDDTDGHVDDLARFIDRNTIAVGVEDNPADVNHAATTSAYEQCRQFGYDVVQLPMPGPVEIEGERMPATYVNFSFVNGGLVVPTYGQDNDDRCLAILRERLPGREVVGVDCSELIWGLGAVHCLTQQQPRPERRKEEG
ncbi:MAG: agmatine deiminase family protein [Planctomycetota bacterium]